MASLAHYYQNVKHGVLNIHPREAEEFGINFGFAAAGGAAIAAMKQAGGGNLDLTVGGMKIPGDALVAGGTAIAGLAMHSEEIKSASLGMAGAASSRFFDSVFAKAFGAHGEIESGMPAQMGMGFGASEQDRLIAKAKQLL